jgi:hypothetical protein
MSESVKLTDQDAEQLLKLIWIAITEFGGTDPHISLRDFAEDIAMSMDHTTAIADSYRVMIAEVMN